MGLKEYVDKNIFSNSLTKDDIKNGDTGFQYWDNLSQHERDKAIKLFKKRWKVKSGYNQVKKMRVWHDIHF